MHVLEIICPVSHKLVLIILYSTPRPSRQFIANHSDHITQPKSPIPDISLDTCLSSEIVPIEEHFAPKYPHNCIVPLSPTSAICSFIARYTSRTVTIQITSCRCGIYLPRILWVCEKHVQEYYHISDVPAGPRTQRGALQA